jgi:hypothetical protein
LHIDAESCPKARLSNPGAGYAVSQESIPDQLIHTTVRIETVNSAGGRGSGTEFITQLCKTDDGFVPVIATNWHVVEGAKEMRFWGIGDSIPISTETNFRQ